jgi:phage protein D
MATKAIPIYTGQDFYVPNFQVKVAGQSQGQDVIRDILQVTYKDQIKGYDTFDITINNWDAKSLDFKYSNKKLFDPGEVMEIWMGYYGKDRLRRMIQGKIQTLQPTFPSSGQPTLTISGRNLLQDFQTQQESHRYEGMKDSQIARQIGGRLGVRVHTDATAAANEKEYDLYQQNEYDIIFLMKRARRIGYDLFVEETESGESRLYFGPSVNIREIVYQLTYGLSLIEFQPNLDTTNQVKEVTVRNADTVNKKTFEATVQRNQIVTKSEKRFEKAFKKRKEVVVTKPIESEAEARQMATETLERIAKEMITGSGLTVGLPDLRAGNVIMIGGLDELFSGRYFVTSTTHTIGDSGYTTKFECRREDL